MIEYRLVEPWDHNGKCVIELWGARYRVSHTYVAPYNKPWFAAFDSDGREIVVRKKFTSVLRFLDRLALFREVA